MLGAMFARTTPGSEDPPFPMTRTMGASGDRLRPDGFADGRICRVCGVVFFAPVLLVPGVEHREKPAGAPFRAEKLVVPSDATEATMEALKEAGYEPLGDGYVTAVHGRCKRCSNPLAWIEGEGTFCLLCPDEDDGKGKRS
jgi:hypothetical protein